VKLGRKATFSSDFECFLSIFSRFFAFFRIFSHFITFFRGFSRGHSPDLLFPQISSDFVLADGGSGRGRIFNVRIVATKFHELARI